ncbi:hypothetical protein LUZ62_072839 [Rhynchospora pubera]|uniref:X8 domain-containing protein n=1 Tax=Rhynchospora pubera TaxID=906938 RepID=A0AAV8D371_9POAL|nr:hypothetical protein LUZ62_072839 [Rhynchospora pubera]
MQHVKLLMNIILLVLGHSVSYAARDIRILGRTAIAPAQAAAGPVASIDNSGIGAVSGLGVNWGTVTYHPLPIDTVVQLLKDNNIKKLKLFGVEHEILTALAGSDIEVMVTVTNDHLADMGSFDAVKEWVKVNLIHYLELKKGVNIAYVAVGNEPFLKDYNGKYNNVVFPALKNIQNALNAANYSRIKATIPINADVLYSPDINHVPSAGVWREDIADLMDQIVAFYHNNSAPFTVNIYPFLSLYYGKGKFPVDYAFFDGNSNPLMDNGAAYTNVLDANYDTLVTVLNKAGYKNMPIIVGEIGWPTDGDINANATLAQKFYKGLVKNLATKKGTPLRPNDQMNVYLFGLIDEEGKSILPGDFERHWGIFTYDGQPKFELDITGKGGKNTLVGAKDVKYLSKQWCVVSPSVTNKTALEANADYACKNADCTSLGNGSSCSNLDYLGQASYAFNSYYQNFIQQSASCHFDGLATITTEDPSSGSCKFDVQLAPAPVPVAPAPEPAPAPVPDSAAGPSNSPSGSPSDQSAKSESVRSAFLSIATIVSLLFGLSAFHSL